MKRLDLVSHMAMAAVISVSVCSSVFAQVSESGHSSSSSTVTEGTVKGYAFKYKQRFDNYAEQIEMGINKGWLSAAQAESFKTRLAELRAMEATAGKAGYPDVEIAKLDKATTKFNEDLSTSSQKTATGDGGTGETKDDGDKK